MSKTVALTNMELDDILTAQLVVAWAGEGGEAKRLGWWRTDMCSEYGGEDLMKRLTPTTWPWAVLETAREAARRTEQGVVEKDHSPDEVFSLYRMGFAIDEQLDERLDAHRRSGKLPLEALPGLVELLEGNWSADKMADWVTGHGDASTTTEPLGQKLTGQPPASIELRTKKLISALVPLRDDYPFPHWRLS